jgi:hypothetical protein
MSGVRSIRRPTESDARRVWARVEIHGLQVVGSFLTGLGIAVVIVACRAQPPYGLTLVAVGAGIALVVAGLCAIWRMREDLVTEITATLTAVLFAFTALWLSLERSAANEFVLAAVLASLTVRVRVFRGGFRGEQRESIAGIEGPGPEPRW